MIIIFIIALLYAIIIYIYIYYNIYIYIRGRSSAPVLVHAPHRLGPGVAARDVEERHEGLVEGLRY